LLPSAAYIHVHDWRSTQNWVASSYLRTHDRMKLSDSKEAKFSKGADSSSTAAASSHLIIRLSNQQNNGRGVGYLLRGMSDLADVECRKGAHKPASTNTLVPSFAYPFEGARNERLRLSDMLLGPWCRISLLTLLATKRRGIIDLFGISKWLILHCEQFL